MQEIFDRTITFKDVVHKLPKKSMQILLKLKNKIKKTSNIILTENDNTQIIRRTHKGKLLKRMILRDQTKLMRVLPQEKLIIVIFSRYSPRIQLYISYKISKQKLQ